MAASRVTLRFSLACLTIGALATLSGCAKDDPVGPDPVTLISNAGPDQVVATEVTVTLDGSGSSASGGHSLTYAWTQVSGPAVALSDPTAVGPTFRTPRRLAALRFTLAISMSDSTSEPDTVTVSTDRFTQSAIATDVAPANSDFSRPGAPGVIAVGEDLLVVTCRLLGAPAGLVGTLVDSSGAALRNIPISSHDCNFAHPSLASGASGLLVVFQRNGEIVATRLSPGPAFTVIGEEVLSTGTSNWGPAVASGSGGFLVTWASFRDPTGYDIYGASLDGTGSSSGEQPLFVQTGEQIGPAVAFDGTNFLVVWQDTRSGSAPSDDTDIYGARVSIAGTVVDPAGIAISTASHAQGDPQLAFDGVNFLAVWFDARRYPAQPQPPLDVFGTRINPAGTLLDGTSGAGGIAISTADVLPATSLYPAVGFDGTNFLVALDVAGFGPPGGIYLARVSSGGVLLDRPSSELGPAIGTAPSDYSRLLFPLVASTSLRTYVVWVDNIELAGESKDIVGVVMDKD